MKPESSRSGSRAGSGGAPAGSGGSGGASAGGPFRIPERFAFDPRLQQQIAGRVAASARRMPFFSVDAFSDLLAYPFQSPGWEARFGRLSLLNAALFALLPPLAEMIEMGIAYGVMRGIFSGGLPALPEQLRPGPILRDGLRWWLASLLFNLPSLLVFFAALGLGIWLCDAPPLGGLGGFPAWFRAVLGQRQFWGGLLVGTSLSFPLGLLSNFLMYVALAHAARMGSFRAALHVTAWGRQVLARPYSFVRAWLSLVGLGLSLFFTQQVVSIPTAPLIFVPALVSAFLSLYRRLIAAAVVAEVMKER